MDGGGGEQREKDEGSWVVVKPNLGGDSEIPRCWSSASSGSVGHEGLNSQWGSGGNNNVGGLSKKAYYVAMSRWKEFSCQELLFQAEARAMSSVTETPQLQCETFFFFSFFFFSFFHLLL